MINIEKYSESPLNGKTILFLGSSVTYGSAAEGQSFVELFETLDGVNAVKEAKSGTTLVDKSTPLAPAIFGDGDSYIKRLKRVDPDAHIDCVLCQLSTNDATMRLPLGDIGDGTVPESRILSPEVFGLTDDAVKQLRQAVYGVCTGAMTIDEAIAGYGTFTE